MSRINVYLTFDVDPDDANTTAERTKISWRGLEEIPAIHQELREREISYTFFVRIDNQMRDIYGSYLGIYYKYRELWDNLRACGNELGWHPHLYQCLADRYVPLRNPETCSDILREAWNEISTLDFEVTSARIGEAWHSNQTMCTLDHLGLSIDSTAVPRRYRNDNVRTFDWSVTQNKPYHPSSNDYRIPGNKDCLKILEVPMTTSPIKTSYDREPLPRYLNLTYHSDLFQTGLQNYLNQLDSDENHHMVLIFHPDELLTRESNGLHAYGWKSFKHNLDILMDCLTFSGYEFRFCCLREALI